MVMAAADAVGRDGRAGRSAGKTDRSRRTGGWRTRWWARRTDKVTGGGRGGQVTAGREGGIDGRRQAGGDEGRTVAGDGRTPVVMTGEVVTTKVVIWMMRVTGGGDGRTVIGVGGDGGQTDGGDGRRRRLAGGRRGRRAGTGAAAAGDGVAIYRDGDGGRVARTSGGVTGGGSGDGRGWRWKAIIILLQIGFPFIKHLHHYQVPRRPMASVLYEWNKLFIPDIFAVLSSCSIHMS